MALHTANWQSLGSGNFYRRYSVYQRLKWGSVDLSSHIVAAAPFGGPVAVMRDPRKTVRVSTQPIGKPQIVIYSACGEELGVIRWSSGTLIQLGWSSNDQLICVQDDGLILVYDLFGNYHHTCSMGNDAKEHHVSEARLFPSFAGTGLVILTNPGRFYAVVNVQEPKVKRFSQTPGVDRSVHPNAWTVFCEDRSLRIYAAYDRDVYRMDTNETVLLYRWSTALLPIEDMAASLDGQNLALLSNGILWIGTSDFRRKEAEFDSRGTARAKQLVWCGSDALVALFEEALLVIAKNGQNWFSYTMDPQLVLLPEIDGVTLISSDSREFLEKVHSSCVEIFRIGSMAPGAMLMEAGKEFMNRSHRADDYLREIRSRLKEAVTQCIKAAGFEPEVELQKSLLRAAKLGKGFIPGYDPAPFVDITRSLRAIHSLKTDAGMPLTHAQYKALGERTVLDRLVARKMYLLALKMAEFLRMPEKDGAHRVLVHWACAKVKETKSGDTETVANAIAEKLGYSAGGISFAEIAGKANELGKKQLAAKLLRFESVSSKQVPLLLKLGEDEEALRQAVASGDSDQVFLVLLHLRDKKNLGEFQMSIRGFPVAQSLYIQLCRLQSRDALRDVYQQEDDFLGQATIRLQEAYAAKTTDGELAMLVGAQDCFKKAKTDAAKLWANLTEEESRLLKYQVSLEQKFRERIFLRRSLIDTVKELLLMREETLADKLRGEFRVNDERFFRLRLQTAAELRDWAYIEKMANLKKVLVGFEVFVSVCLERNQISEAKKYLPRVKDSLKVKYYVQAKLLGEAARIAFERKSLEDMNLVQSRCKPTDREVLALIAKYTQQLASSNPAATAKS